MSKKKRRTKSKKRPAKTEAPKTTKSKAKATAPELGDVKAVRPARPTSGHVPFPRSGLDGFFFGAVDPVRPWLLQRLFLLVLAFDCWLDLVPHGGRYGFNDFNVSHFAILDALQPTPTSGVYVGCMLLAGLAAFVMALSRPTRVGMAATCVLYTYGWLMSMLDSYQHHYLVSWLLFAMIFFPRLTGDEVFPAAVTAPKRRRPAVLVGGLLFAYGLYEVTLGVCEAPTPIELLGPGAAIETPSWMWLARFGLLVLGGLMAFLPVGEGPGETPVLAPDPPKTSAWAYVLLGVTCAIVYFYTAVSKLSPDWREGHALSRLGRTDALGGLLETATSEGLPIFGVMTADEFWEWMAWGAIAVQVVTCAGYLVACRVDTIERRWLKLGLLGALVAPISFHIGAELGLSLDIGWFSYYMILVALIYFLPATMLRRASEGFVVARRALTGGFDRVASAPLAPFGIGLVAAFVGLFVGAKVDLPGSHLAGAAFGASVAAAAAWATRRGRGREARAWSTSAVFGLLLMWVSIANSDARFDFYRFVGGEYRRHDEPQLAYDAYVKANRYVVSPWCIYQGRSMLTCYRDEAYAQQVAERDPSYELRRRDRQRQQEEMERRLERNAAP